MATERQIQANRANAKRSTGPVTEKGKQASSQNALRHGQLSSCVVLTAESTPFFNQLMDSLIEEFQPRTANEIALIETMAVARWKLMRNWTIHTGLLEIEMAKQDQEAGNPPVLAALTFKSLADSSCSMKLRWINTVVHTRRAGCRSFRALRTSDASRLRTSAWGTPSPEGFGPARPLLR